MCDTRIEYCNESCVVASHSRENSRQSFLLYRFFSRLTVKIMLLMSVVMIYRWRLSSIFSFRDSFHGCEGNWNIIDEGCHDLSNYRQSFLLYKFFSRLIIKITRILLLSWSIDNDYCQSFLFYRFFSRLIIKVTRILLLSWSIDNDYCQSFLFYRFFSRLIIKVTRILLLSWSIDDCCQSFLLYKFFSRLWRQLEYYWRVLSWSIKLSSISSSLEILFTIDYKSNSNATDEGCHDLSNYRQSFLLYIFFSQLIIKVTRILLLSWSIDDDCRQYFLLYKFFYNNCESNSNIIDKSCHNLSNYRQSFLLYRFFSRLTVKIMLLTNVIMIYRWRLPIIFSLLFFSRLRL